METQRINFFRRPWRNRTLQISVRILQLKPKDVRIHPTKPGVKKEPTLFRSGAHKVSSDLFIFIFPIWFFKYLFWEIGSYPFLQILLPDGKTWAYRRADFNWGGWFYGIFLEVALFGRYWNNHLTGWGGLAPAFHPIGDLPGLRTSTKMFWRTLLLASSDASSIEALSSRRDLSSWVVNS